MRIKSTPSPKIEWFLKTYPQYIEVLGTSKYFNWVFGSSNVNTFKNDARSNFKVTNIKIKIKQRDQLANLIINADSPRLDVVNDLDEIEEAIQGWDCQVFIGCKAFRTETGIWCGWPIQGSKTKAAPATVSGLGLLYATGKPGRLQTIMPPARRPAY